MSIRLPEPIAAYFAATNAHDVDAMLARFAKTAIVKDEGKTMRGADAVRQWMEETIRKYAFSVEALAIAAAEDKAVVTTRVSGSFPGSPIELRYDITLAGGKISRLEIHP
ncbi:MAG TPA: nuclear transport factor 2 family protein [Burkholderiales bacterium]